MIGEKECSDVFPQSHAFRMETEGVALIHTYSGCVHELAFRQGLQRCSCCVGITMVKIVKHFRIIVLSMLFPRKQLILSLNFL